jgi:hypothetical protein
MTWVVRKHTHSSRENCKYVKHENREFSKHFTAEDRSFSLAVFKASKNSIAFDFEEA